MSDEKIEEARAILAGFMDTEIDRLKQENAKLRARVERLEKLREASINYIEGIKPPLGHDRHRLWLILTAAIALTNCEASDDKQP